MKNFEKLLARSRAEGNPNPVIEGVPYANTLGMKGLLMGEDLIYHLPKNNTNLGNPFLPAIHGGCISGFMELAASFQVMFKGQSQVIPKVVNFAVDYLRAGRHQDTYAAVELVRQGRTVVNASVIAWQNCREDPIATARCHFLLPGT